MDKYTKMDENFAEILILIDELLSRCKVEIQYRPFEATIIFIKEFVLGIEVGGKQIEPNREKADFTSEFWFASLYQVIEKWYKNRYGKILSKSPNKQWVGFVVIWGFPFGIKIPLSILSSGKREKTVCLRFPDSLLENENPEEWLLDPPNLSNMKNSERTQLINMNIVQVDWTGGVNAAATTGPASGPRPASSMPATRRHPFFFASVS